MPKKEAISCAFSGKVKIVYFLQHKSQPEQGFFINTISAKVYLKTDISILLI